MLQEQNKNLSFPSYNPSTDVKRGELQLQREAQDQHCRASKLANPSQNCPAAEIDLFHLSSLLPAVAWASPWLENLLSSRFRAGVLHCQHLHHGYTGSVPLCLDFQVGENSGPSCSSPSLIIPVVIIPLNSRQLEGKKKILIYQQPGSKKCRGCLGSSKGRLSSGFLPSLSLQTKGAASAQLSSNSPRLGNAPHTLKPAVEGGSCMGNDALATGFD